MMRDKEAAFTTVELIIVIVIVSILAVVVIAGSGGIARTRWRGTAVMTEHRAWNRFLLPLAPFYRGAVTARIAAYRKGWLRSSRLSVPVISVGNPSARRSTAQHSRTARMYSR